MAQKATAVELPFWKDPQSPIAVTIAAGACNVFFALWDSSDSETLEELGKITFSGCWATNTVVTEFLPYDIAQHTFHSFIVEVIDSDWLASATQTRAQTYERWQSWDNRTYQHYVVKGADSYLEVLAASFTAGMASLEECQRYAFLRG